MNGGDAVRRPAQNGQEKDGRERDFARPIGVLIGLSGTVCPWNRRICPSSIFSPGNPHPGVPLEQYQPAPHDFNNYNSSDSVLPHSFDEKYWFIFWFVAAIAPGFVALRFLPYSVTVVLVIVGALKLFTYVKDRRAGRIQKGPTRLGLHD